MRRTRHILAVVMVTTAIYADRSAIAAPEKVESSAGLARAIAAKLTHQLRRAVASPRVLTVRRSELPRLASSTIRNAAAGVRLELSPFQFRLPPPAA